MMETETAVEGLLVITKQLSNYVAWLALICANLTLYALVATGIWYYDASPTDVETAFLHLQDATFPKILAAIGVSMLAGICLIERWLLKAIQRHMLEFLFQDPPENR